jgi:aldehyde dehydrogenase (NAD+)
MTAVAEPSIVESQLLAGGPKKLLIDGKWLPAASGKTFPSINPSNGEVLAELAEGDAPDVELAVAAARRAFEGPWSTMTPSQRQRIMWDFADLIERNREELRVLQVLDMGAPIGHKPAPGANDPAEVLRYYAGWATKIHGETIPNSVRHSMFSYTLREPVGVVAAIVPWNNPLGNALVKIAPVLAAGCTMVLKPAEEAGLVALRLGELLCELDLPAGVVNIITGFGETAGAALAEHRDVDKVAFTGSSVTGQRIVRAATGNMKRVSLELGGKSPDIVFADADLDKAVPVAAMGVFANSGQACIAGSRIFVERKVYDDFVDGVAKFAGSLKVGPGLDPETQIGPLVSAQQLERVEGYLDLGPKEGVRTVTGGARLREGNLSNGYFIPPTVFADVSDDMRVAQEEIFGPVACMMPFDDVDEVIARSNRTDFGLGSGVWTRDAAKAHRLARSIRAGAVWVNTYGQFDPAMPFGGYKRSGWGSEFGREGLDEYLNLKSVWIDTE